MTPELRQSIAASRTDNYVSVMRTTMFTFLGVAAVLNFGPDAFSGSLFMVVIAITAYGVLAGGAALDDLQNLKSDMDEEFAATGYGTGLSERNIPTLKMISSVLVGLTGLVELLAILF